MVSVVLERDATEEERDDAGHRESIREEIAGISAESDKAGFNGRVVMQIGMFEEKGHS